jgi:hypothetical protein
MNKRAKRTVSFGVFGLGIVAGLAGCAIAPRAVFVIGVNDSTPEVLALLLPITLLPASILALWKRIWASVWFCFLGLLWSYGMIWQRHYISVVQHFPEESLRSLLGGEMLPAYFVFALAAFGLLTSNAHWPQMLGISAKNEQFVQPS